MEPTFVQRLILAQQSLNVKKDGTNPRFSSKYVTLDALLDQAKPALGAQGLLLTQSIEMDHVLTNITDGTLKVEARTPICATRDLPQAFAAAATYARRIGISGLLCISESDDDDGNHAQAAAEAAPAPRRGNIRPALPDNMGRPTSSDNDFQAPDLSAYKEPHLRVGNTVVHFGKNKLKRLADLSERSLAWYCDDWELSMNPNTGQLNPVDEALKLAAIQWRSHLEHPGSLDNNDQAHAAAITNVTRDEADGIPF